MSYLCTRVRRLSHSQLSTRHALVAELVDAPDLGSGISDVQVRVLSGAPNAGDLPFLGQFVRFFFP